MQRILNQKHDKFTWTNAVSRLFERAAYYGLRAIVILYLIDETIGMSEQDAFQIYGWLSFLLIFSKILGAILGDFVLGNKSSIIIGGLLQALGAFTLCVPNNFAIYSGLALVIIGNGLYNSNMIAYFGKLYLTKVQLLDAGFTIYYIASNIGAFLGVFFIGYIGERYDWSFGFIIAGILTLISISFPIFFQKKTEEVPSREGKPTNWTLLTIGSAFVFVAIYWLIRNFIDIETIEISNHFAKSYPTIVPNLIYDTWGGIISLIASAVLVFYWSKYYTSQLKKLLIGFIFLVFSLGQIFILREHTTLYFLLPFVLSILISEIYIYPVINSLITQHVNSKYLTTALSLTFIPTSLFMFLASYLIDYHTESPTIFSVVLFLIATLLTAVLAIFIKKSRTKNS